MNVLQTDLGWMFYTIDEEELEIYLYDSDKKYINYDMFESYSAKGDIEEIRKGVCDYYRHINTTDESIIKLGEPVMWSDSLEGLLEKWNEYCKEECEKYDEEFEEYSMEEFLENIQTNRIGKTYFAIYYTEY